MKRKTSWTLYLLLELVLLVCLLLITNPFNWFVKKSSHFTAERFEKVEPGMSKEQLVEILGPPLRITKPSIADTRCTGCSVYLFMGDPPGWLPGFEEAWVDVGPDGQVRDKLLHDKP